MSQVAFSQEALDLLHDLASRQENETCAAGLIHLGDTTQHRHVVRALSPVPDAAYQQRTPVAAALTPEFILALANRARAEGAGVALLHTHPGQHPLEDFSPNDDAGELSLAEYFGRRVPDQVHLAGVVTHSKLHLRSLGGQARLTGIGVGRSVRIYGAEASEPQEDQRYDRQVRAFGEAGQACLRKLRVAVIGAGGTGSFIAHQLAYLGVGQLVLIDHDTVDTSNLNRLLGATQADIGQPKVAIAQRAVQMINPGVQCEALVGDVVDAEITTRLLDVDFIFGCTDSMASRAVINQLAYQYLIPAIDMGVAIHIRDHSVAYVTGRTQMLSQGLGCLVCADGIDGNQVRWEMMTPAQRRADPYFKGASVPQPAVMPLNGIVTSAAVAMFLSAITGYPGDARLLHYDGIRGSLRPQLMAPRPGCIVCGSEGALARGTSWALPVRQGNVHD